MLCLCFASGHFKKAFFKVLIIPLCIPRKPFFHYVACSKSGSCLAVRARGCVDTVIYSFMVLVVTLVFLQVLGSCTLALLHFFYALFLWSPFSCVDFKQYSLVSLLALLLFLPAIFFSLRISEVIFNGCEKPPWLYLSLLWLMLAFILTRLWNWTLDALKTNTEVCMNIANCYVRGVFITTKLALQKSSTSLSVTAMLFTKVVCCYGLLPPIAKYCIWKHWSDYSTSVEVVCVGVMGPGLLEHDLIAGLYIRKRTSSLSKAEQSKSSDVDLCFYHDQKLPNSIIYCQVWYMVGSRKMFEAFRSNRAQESDMGRVFMFRVAACIGEEWNGFHPNSASML